jgi:predicted TIM-barrel fold metal-dependent hydrolase
VLTLSTPPLELVFGPHDTPDLARMANDEMAEMVAKYPDRFVAAIASLPMNNMDAANEELDRAVKQLKMKGILIYTSINGKPLDAPEFSFLFEKMAQYDLPIWIHPARRENFADYETEERSKYQIWACFGWPYDTSAAMARILFTGVFDRYPNLKIITHHLGGLVPYFSERIRDGFDAFGTRSAQDDKTLLAQLKRHPYEYYRMYYADTALNGSIPALECGLAFFGSDRVLFGTDMPFGPDDVARKIRKTIQSVEGMTACSDDKEKIYEFNARKLLKL